MINTRPTPTGWQHFLELRLEAAPANRHTDPLAALDDMEGGLTPPVAEVIEEHADGSALVRVSLFTESPQPGASEIASIEGLIAELRYAVSSAWPPTVS